MKVSELATICKGIAPVVRDYVKASLADLDGRVAAFESKDFTGPQGPHGLPGPEGAKGIDGRVGDLGPEGARGEKGDRGDTGDSGQAGVKGDKGDPGEPGEVGERGPQGEQGRAGKDADPEVIRAEVARAVAEIPVPKDGARGADGKDADPVLVQQLLDEVTHLKEQVATIRAEAVAQQKSFEEFVMKTVAEQVAVVRDHVQKSLAAIQPVRDGVGIATAVVDGAGHLVLTMSDGKSLDLGAIVGKDGRDGLPGVPGRWGEKGPDGRDGIDGLGFDDVSVVHDGERSFEIVFSRGDKKKSFGPFTIPTVLDRGVFEAGRSYQKGDGVTWGGSFWIAQKETNAKPGLPDAESRAWRLAVKKGNDGKSGNDGKPGPAGRDGHR